MHPCGVFALPYPEIENIRTVERLIEYGWGGGRVGRLATANIYRGGLYGALVHREAE